MNKITRIAGAELSFPMIDSLINSSDILICRRLFHALKFVNRIHPTFLYIFFEVVHY